MGILINAPTRHREPGAPPVEANDASPDLTGALHIREVVRITGLRREQLYMWQRRYGFPAPLRDPFGDRVYPPDQVARLKLIKQLLSEGWLLLAVMRREEGRHDEAWQLADHAVRLDPSRADLEKGARALRAP